MIAGLCDMFDGKIASTMERTRQEKRFGVQIDSLSDLICFGVLPALIVYSGGGRLNQTAWTLEAGDDYTLIPNLTHATAVDKNISWTSSDAAIATSGDMFQYFEIDSVRYSHIIDPRSGEPLTTRSVVSVLAPGAAAADALASGISVLGPDAGIRLAESLPEVETLVITAPSGEEEGAVPRIAATGRFLRIRDELAEKEHGR